MIYRSILALGVALMIPALAMADLSVTVTYLKQQLKAPPTLSNLDPLPADLGEMGVLQGLQDNLSTGQFLGHVYDLNSVMIPPEGDYVTAARRALAVSPFLVMDAPTAQITAVADLPEARNAVLFNISSEDMTLRGGGCRGNLFHAAPSLRMRSDAVMQFALAKRWNDLALITGAHPPDRAFAKALRHSAQKFGLKIAAEKDWVFDADMRRNAAHEVPLFTQDLGDYDMLLVADETRDFGRYIPYNTWRPRPIAGSEGLNPTAWAPVVEQWGAAQLQSRFHETANRKMHPRDYAGWVAIRTIGEAVTRTNSDDPATLRGYILSGGFELAGFKGRPLSYRPWNGQLRQPIVLATARAQVANAPLPGFLHQHNEMDTLGLDRPESDCEAFQ